MAKKIFVVIISILFLFFGCAQNEPPINLKNQEKAIESAKYYLLSAPYSKSGIIALLEESGYSAEEAKFAAENCGADWKTEAYRYAKNLMEFSSFSKEVLVFQLEIKGFTQEEAAYGASKIYP